MKGPRRHRRVRLSLTIGLAGTAIVLAVAALTGNAHGNATARPREATTIPRSPRHALTSSPADPFSSAAVRAYLATRHGDITAALENLSTGRISTYRAGVAEQTASIIKVTILSTLLNEAQRAHRSLTPTEQEEATGMIEQSDNDDATALWDDDGGAPAIARYCAAAGCTDTSPNTEGYWGETTTTASDQLAILRHLVTANALLTAASRAYTLHLMDNVTSWERWGVPTGIPAKVSVAVKNGWVPIVAGNWQINTIGYVHGDGRDYLLAILTNENPTEAYGITTVDGLSARVFDALARPRG